MQKVNTLKSALKVSPPEVREYVSELDKQIAKLQRRNAQLQASQFSREQRVVALEKELKKHGVVSESEELARRLEAARKRRNENS